MRKKFTSLQKEIDDHKDEIKKYQVETTKLNNVIRNLEKDISGLKKEIQERDETIQDKVGSHAFCRKVHANVKYFWQCIFNSQIPHQFAILDLTVSAVHYKIQLKSCLSHVQEKRIYDLKKKNQELEKFKFVLDYKIKELKKQIEPRENDIKAMKEQIQEVYREKIRHSHYMCV